jgi:hypothetical protein
MLLGYLRICEWYDSKIFKFLILLVNSTVPFAKEMSGDI